MYIQFCCNWRKGASNKARNQSEYTKGDDDRHVSLLGKDYQHLFKFT